MKRFILACATFALIGSMSSCVKTHTCTCTYNDGTNDVTETVEYKTKKGAAETACSLLEAGYKGTDPDASCNL